MISNDQLLVMKAIAPALQKIFSEIHNGVEGERSTKIFPQVWEIA